MNEKFTEISIEKEMKKSYLDYAMSVIIGRALPDVRDGLKPVHRRILYAMNDLRNDWNKPYKKSARIVGDVIGKYHPHGDTAVYDAMVRMAQPFSLRYRLVDGQGNFGSIDGDPPAAMRYTEVRMTKLAHQMLEDLDKETVDVSANYDETLTEPCVLPSKIPNLLINGSSGIAVGMTTNIPPHNISEIIDACIALIDNPYIEMKELIKIVPGPDFPTAGIIYGTEGIYSAYDTGRGVIKIRAKVKIEEDKKTKQETIVVTELPYQTNKAELIAHIASLVKNKQIEGIKYVRDESDRDGMRIAIALKKEGIPDVVINQLYKHTKMSASFGIILLAVVNNKPELLPLKRIIEHFILHRKEIIVKRTIYDLRKAEEKAHILEGLKIAIENLDDVVALIRNSASPAIAKEGLVKRFFLTEIQAQAVLDMRLQRLTGLERDKIMEELKSILKDIAKYKEILSSERIVLSIIKEELQEIKKEFGDKRLTRIVEETKQITMEDMIAEEEMAVTISSEGYIKRVPISVYRQQKRGGKGKTAMGTKEEDFVKHLFVASTHHTFLFFTSHGKVYQQKVYEIPQAGRTGKGKAIVNMLNLEENEKIATVLAVPSFDKGSYVLTVTKKGIIKKTDIMAYSRYWKKGIKALTLFDDDELIAARIIDGKMNIFIASALGKAIRFKESDVRDMGRTARGVIGFRLEKRDYIIGMEVVKEGETLFAVTENGYGKRTSIDEYRTQSRGGKGIITIKTTQRNGVVVAILLVNDEDEIMLITNKGRLIRIPVGDISVIGRNTQGVTLMGMHEEEKVVAAARLEA